MNKINNNIHQCSQCKKDFPAQEVYRIGMKGKEFFCRKCAKNNDRNNSNILQAAKKQRAKEISNKEISLQQAKENGENEMVVKLEQQIKELKNQQQGCPVIENSTKNNAITYSIVGLALVALVGLVILLVKPRQKKPKIN